MSTIRDFVPFLCATLLGGALLLSSPSCGGTKNCTSSCGAGDVGGGSAAGGAGGTMCTSTKGTLSGTVYLNALPDQPNSMIAPNATVDFVLSPGGPDATVLHGQADEFGKFEVEIDAGTWLVGGDDGSGCINSQPVTVTLDACSVEPIQIVLDICSG